MDQSRVGDTTEPKAPLPAETVSLPARGFTIDRSKALIAAGVLYSLWKTRGHEEADWPAEPEDEPLA
mgnify:FL=1